MAEPQLTVTTEHGAPGSAFSFTGSGLPANTNFSVSVNGTVVVPQLSSDGEGRLRFVLQTTTQARTGTYTVIVRGTTANGLQAELTLTSRYVLDSAAAVVQPEAGFPAPINVPESIAPVGTVRVYLPFVVRAVE